MSDILLEAGTGEVEIIEFVVNKQSYAINVLKVKGIIQMQEIVPLPQSVEEIMGMTEIRGNTNMVIDLNKVLHGKRSEEYQTKLGLLCEFNGSIVVFLVDEVKGIVKITWEQIEQPSQVKQDMLMIGSILRPDGIIILLDFEAITIRAGLGQSYEKQAEHMKLGRHIVRDTKIVFVEDSKAIREMLRVALNEAGYENVTELGNGKEALDYIFDIKERLGESFRKEIDILITDIEMPILDGYTLTRKIKEDEIMKNLSVVIFSSLISEELKHKGVAVGADIQIGKSSVRELISAIDKLSIKK